MMEKQSAEPTGPLNCFINSLRIRKSEQEAWSGKELVFGFSYLSPPSGRPSNGQTSRQTQMCCLPPQAVQAGH